MGCGGIVLVNSLNGPGEEAVSELGGVGPDWPELLTCWSNRW